MKHWLLACCLMSGMGALTSDAKKPLDVQGHRGCRGWMPENTIPAFLKALDLGVTTLEMDVVVTKDHRVILSHEPFLSHEICLGPRGEAITEATQKSYNLYRMSYAQVQACDCGSRPHPRFPDQRKMVAHKPLLAAVIDTVEAYIKRRKLPPVQYNIETKSEPAGDGIFHPGPETFVQLLMRVVQEKGIQSRTIIQSFDPRTLRVMHRQYPHVKLALLVENGQSPVVNVQSLGFIPTIYSPHLLLVNPDLIQYAHQQSMQVIPWTANEPAEIQRLLNLKVDGIISDYPDRVLNLAKKQK
jgi:glycerophosphoryl diester phosphodiesterase